MNMNFADAPTGGNFKTIPDGTLLFGQLLVKPYNLDQGVIEKPAKDPSSTWRGLDYDIKVIGGEFDGQELRYNHLTTSHEKQDVVDIGRSNIRAILETGKKASQKNPAGYSISSYADLHGLLVAVEVKEETYKDKVNAKVGKFLSANPEGQYHKQFLELMNNYGGTIPNVPPVEPMAGRETSNNSNSTNTAPAAGNGSWDSDAPATAESKGDGNFPF
ncbi:MAG: hypothetical protein CMF62_06245 [Magnetococcales bacterium]|nr:hypothetical protein [Magnetococcales bacterium]|tara:strand:+ start:285410 stop:286060 length:651 start_codon:yes stop_codon:yes gene_type:complete